MTILSFKFQKNHCGFAVFNPEDVEGIEIDDKQLVKITHINGSPFVVLEAFISEEAPVDCVLCDQNIAENLGFTEGDFVEYEPFDRPMKFASEVNIEFSTANIDPSEMYKPGNVESLKNFLEKYSFPGNTDLFWPDLNATIRVEFIEPQIQPGEIYLLDFTKPVQYSLHEKVPTMAFNAILLIDKSRSMTTRNINLEGSESTINELKHNLLEGKDGSQFPTLIDLFDNLINPNPRVKHKDVEGNITIKPAKGASRINAVLLATLLFFQLKMSRGVGEKCAFVIYSDNAKNLEFPRGNFIEATEFNATNCEKIVHTIKSKDFIKIGNTNISGGLRYCQNLALELKKSNARPLMILLLTDGRPYPPEIDNEKTVFQTIRELSRKFDQEDIPFVLFVIGIGDSKIKCKLLLTELASIGRGEFHYANNVDELIEWYQRLAKNFSVKIISRPKT